MTVSYLRHARHRPRLPSPSPVDFISAHVIGVERQGFSKCVETQAAAGAIAVAGKTFTFDHICDENTSQVRASVVILEYSSSLSRFSGASVHYFFSSIEALLSPSAHACSVRRLLFSETRKAS
jgi:hypothetical protein